MKGLEALKGFIDLKGASVSREDAHLLYADRIFGILMPLQYLLAVGIALIYSPVTYVGDQAWVHPHLHTALLMGGLIAVPVTAMAWLKPGWENNRYAIAIGQMLMGALLIHVTGGRIETHFHVFVSLAFLSFYRDWTVLLIASVVIATDHFLRGFYLPQSIYGVASGAQLRVLEHAAWVLLEDVILGLAIHRSTQDAKENAEVAKIAEEAKPPSCAFYHSPAAALILSVDGLVQNLNQVAETTFGANLLGTPFDARFALHDPCWDELTATNATHELTLTRADGTTFQAETTLVPYPEGDAFFAYLRPVDESLPEILGLVADEIEPPAQAVKEGVRSMREAYQALSKGGGQSDPLEAMPTALAKSEKAAEEIEGAVRALRSRADGLQFVNLNQIIRKVVTPIQTKSGIGVEAAMGRNMPLVWTDVSGFSDILQDLVVQSAEAIAAAQGSGKGVVRVSTGVSRSGDVHLRIEDGGNSTATGILEPMRQATLANLQEKIRRMGGKLLIGGDTESNAVFEIRFPQSTGDAAQPQAA